MILLDEYRERKLAGIARKHSGNKPRLRRRPPNPVDSTLDPPKDGAKDIYDENWLKSQTVLTTQALQIDSKLVMPNTMQKLKQVC
jgi:hypothetical protein